MKKKLYYIYDRLAAQKFIEALLIKKIVSRNNKKKK